MAYNSSTGSLHVGDLLNEDDEDTQVDFGYDSIIFRTNRLARLEVNNSFVDISVHNGSSTGLKLGGTLVTSTAAELNLLDGCNAGTQVPSKAVIYTTKKGISANSITGSHSVSSSMGITGSSLQVGTYGLTNDGRIAINTLTLGGTLVTSTAAELNLVDGSSAGSAVASKAVIYDAQKGIVAQSVTGSVLSASATAFAGQIGIGTTSPDHILHAKATSTDGDAFIMAEVAGGGDAEVGLMTKTPSGQWIAGYAIQNSSAWTLHQSAPTSGARISVIDGGNVGIGTTSPKVKLDVNGSLTVSGSTILGDAGTDVIKITGDLTASNGILINVDNKSATFGAGSDLDIYHDGSNSNIKNSTGHLIINNNATDKHIRLQLGEDTADTAVQVRNNSNSSVWGVDALGQVSGSGTSIVHGDLTTNSNFILEFGSKIPQYAVVTRVALVVKTASNLSTHVANIRLGTVSGRGADTDISGESLEILGAGASGTRSSDNTSAAEDIDLKNDPKEVWINQDLGFMTTDVYPYLCNAGTGNGTTNSSTGTVIAYIEWIGLD